MGNTESTTSNPEDPLYNVTTLYRETYDILMNTLSTDNEEEAIFFEFKQFIRQNSHNYSITTVHPKYGTLFHIAAVANNGKVIEYLIDIMTKDCTLLSSPTNDSSTTTTGSKEEPSLVKRLLNHKDKEGYTPLFLAVQNNSLKALQMLVSIPEIDINLPCLSVSSSAYSFLHPVTPLYLAVFLNSIETVKLLLEHPRIDITGKSSITSPSVRSHASVHSRNGLSEENVLTIAKRLGYDTIVTVLESQFTMNTRRSILSRSMDKDNNPAQQQHVFQYTTDAIDYPSSSSSLTEESLSSFGAPSTSSAAASTVIRNKKYQLQSNENFSDYIQRITKEGHLHKEAGRYEVAINIYTLLLDEYKKYEKNVSSIKPSIGGSDDGNVTLPDIYFNRASCLQRIHQIEAGMMDYELALSYLLKDNRIVAVLYGHAECGIYDTEDTAEVAVRDNTTTDTTTKSSSFPYSRTIQTTNPSALRRALNDLELVLRLVRSQEFHQRSSVVPHTNRSSRNTNEMNDKYSSGSIQRLINRIEDTLETIDHSYTRKIPGKDKTYYQILKISNDAKDVTIRQAYRQLSLAYHPDKYSGWADTAVVQRMVTKTHRINEAYEVLSDPTRRIFYDLELRAMKEMGTQR